MNDEEKGLQSLSGQIRRNAVAIISLVVALTSLGYNTWRNERTEANRNIRHAGFALIQEMAALQRTIFAIRYQDAEVEPAVQDGWIEVLTIRDLSHAMPTPVQQKAGELLDIWDANARDADSATPYQRIDDAIDGLRESALSTLRSLD